MAIPQSSSASPAPMRAGGRATQAGMSFQAAVATWLAVHVLARVPVGGRFGINNQALPVAIRLETGDGLDDIEVSQSDGGVLQIQCKTSASLSTGQNAPLTKTIGQLARWVADAKAAGNLPDTTRNAAVLAVRAESAQSLNDLEKGCRAFDFGGVWATTHSQRNQAERTALGAFATIATPAWTVHRGTAPGDDDLVDMARVFHLARFAMDEGASDWRESSQMLGRNLFGNESAGDAPLRDLMGIMSDLIGSGASADRDGLLREMRRRGHNDVGAPRFEADVAALRSASARELTRLGAHAQLPLGAGVPIKRECDTPLVAAILSGSLVVVGEPGAGKTGALVNAAAEIARTGNTVVVLSVDRFPGVAIAADLESELGLTHPVIDVLAAVPGASQKVLIIDALDAARGGPSETVFATLIEQVRERLANDWVVVASIRTFDLKNGRRFRQAFAGSPANADYVDPTLSGVRHFLVPRLAESDLTTAAAASPELAALLASAPSRLAGLLRNIFNLSLAAQLLADGANPAAFSTIRNQSGLIDVYEDTRLSTTELQRAAGATAGVMARRRRLSVRKVAIEHSAVDAVIRTGVLIESGDLVNFAHHVLFDHVASRFYLAWDDPGDLLAQLAGDTSSALLLAPALRFAVERLWRDDDVGRPRSWKLLIGIFTAASVDPVLGNVALRIVVENIENEQDLNALSAQLAATPSEPALMTLLGHLARFAAMGVEVNKNITPAQATAWARLAQGLVATGKRGLVDPARVLLHMLFEHGDITDTAVLDVFGRAARALLEISWATTPPLETASVNAIRFVGKSFASDPVASRALLDQILRPPHFTQYADREAPWLAEQIVPITRVDPEFTVEVYAELYGQAITDDATSWFGGQPSRIMPLLSNRKQAYMFCRWRLGTAISEVLTISPEHGTRAVIDGLIGKARRRDSNGAATRIHLGTNVIELRGHDVEFNAWDEAKDNRTADDDLLRHYARFLQNCDRATFAASVAAASRDYATASVWSRILGVGSERVAEVGDLLWPLIERPDLLENPGILRDAVRFVAAAWSSRTSAERIRFETMALDRARSASDKGQDRWRQILGRIFALVPKEALELNEMRALRDELSAGGLLIENRPLFQFTITAGGNDHVAHNQLRRAGVVLESGPHREVFDASEALHAQVGRTPSDSSAQALTALWNDAMSLLASVDASSGLHSTLDRSAWGHIANAVERVASSPNYVPGADGMPDLTAMFAVLSRLSASHYPELPEAAT